MFFAALVLTVGHPVLLISIVAGLSVLAGMTLITAQTQGPLVPTTSPDWDTYVAESSNIPFQYEVLTGTTDVITGGGGPLGSTKPISGTSFIESTVVDACTLANPVAGAPSAGGNDGLTITIIDNGGHAHTVTTAAGKIAPAHHLATFNGTVGSFVELMARNGVWIPLASSGVTIT